MTSLSRHLALRCLLAGVVVASTSVMSMSMAAAQAFATCDEAAAAGFSNMREGEPGYSPALDENGDGVACEDNSVAPAEVLGSTETQQQPPAEIQSPQAPPALDAPTAPVDGELAETGVSSWVLMLAAAMLLLAGRRFISAGYDRLDWRSGRSRSDVRYTIDSRRRRR